MSNIRVLMALFGAIPFVTIVFWILNIQMGVIPRTVDGLWGIPLMAFQHADKNHLLGNMAALLGLGVLASMRSPALWRTILVILLTTGGLLWLAGGHGEHIGASGLVFGLFGYGLSGIWSKSDSWLMHLVKILVMIATVVFYGYLMTGIGWFAQGISWEGHFAGLIAGFLWGRWEPTPKVESGV